MPILFVGLGGSIGAVLRYSLSLLIPLQAGFPLATWLTNCIGALLLSYLTTSSHLQHPQLKLALTTGLLGAFTTFSTFSAETLHLYEQQHYLLMLLYVATTLLGGLVCSFLGFWLGGRTTC